MIRRIILSHRGWGRLVLADHARHNQPPDATSLISPPAGKDADHDRPLPQPRNYQSTSSARNITIHIAICANLPRRPREALVTAAHTDAPATRCTSGRHSRAAAHARAATAASCTSTSSASAAPPASKAACAPSSRPASTSGGSAPCRSSSTASRELPSTPGAPSPCPVRSAALTQPGQVSTSSSVFGSMQGSGLALIFSMYAVWWTQVSLPKHEESALACCSPPIDALKPNTHDCFEGAQLAYALATCTGRVRGPHSEGRTSVQLRKPAGVQAAADSARASWCAARRPLRNASASTSAVSSTDIWYAAAYSIAVCAANFSRLLLMAPNVRGSKSSFNSCRFL